MGTIFVKDREGIEHKLPAEEGLTIMEIIRDAGLDIEAACGGCCACATCHIYVDENRLKNLEDIKNAEESMLDQAFNIKEESRLGCQIEYKDNFNGLKVRLAPE